MSDVLNTRHSKECLSIIKLSVVVLDILALSPLERVHSISRHIKRAQGHCVHKQFLSNCYNASSVFFIFCTSSVLLLTHIRPSYLLISDLHLENHHPFPSIH